MKIMLSVTMIFITNINVFQYDHNIYNHISINKTLRLNLINIFEFV